MIKKIFPRKINNKIVIRMGKGQILHKATADVGDLESKHVHHVYNNIAGHFSKTRYKPWPVIESFLQGKPRGSLIGDIGCGNGKYMNVNDQNIQYIGADRSENLIELAQKLRPKSDCMVADALNVPFRDATFDHCISIAVIHHMSTEIRRMLAIQELLRIVRPGGQILIFVWAMEQTESSRYQFEDQDVFVPWNLAGACGNNNSDSTSNSPSVYQRFYHVFKKGELSDLARKASFRSGIECEIVQEGYDKDNWFVILERRA